MRLGPIPLLTRRTSGHRVAGRQDPGRGPVIRCRAVHRGPRTRAGAVGGAALISQDRPARRSSMDHGALHVALARATARLLPLYEVRTTQPARDGRVLTG